MEMRFTTEDSLPTPNHQLGRSSPARCGVPPVYVRWHVHCYAATFQGRTNPAVTRKLWRKHEAHPDGSGPRLLVHRAGRRAGQGRREEGGGRGPGGRGEAGGREGARSEAGGRDRSGEEEEGFG